MYLLAQETCSLVDDIRFVSLTQGQFTRINARVCDRVTQFNWFAARSNPTKPFYAARSIRTNLGNGQIGMRRVSLARFLLNLEDDNPLWADHIDGDTLNNTDDNLRAIPEWENKKNRRIQSNNTSGFKGVSWHNPDGPWVAYICVNRKNVYLGLHSTPELAYAVYCEAAIKYFGEFARAG